MEAPLYFDLEQGIGAVHKEAKIAERLLSEGIRETRNYPIKLVRPLTHTSKISEFSEGCLVLSP